MANYSNLKTAIENAVDWNNGDNEITGQNLLDILETIIDSLGAKYKFADVATPSSSITTPDEPLFYLAGEGTYTNFSGLSVTIPRGTLAIFYYDTAWHYTTVRTDSDAFFNVNQYLGTPSTTYTKANGRNAVPSALRSKGMIITYLTTNGWLIEQNLSTSGTWNADANWQTIGPVSVSQNTQTGHAEIMIGGVANPVASTQDLDKVEFNSDFPLSKQITMESGYIACGGNAGTSVSLTPVAHSTYTHAIVDCKEGEIFYIQGRGGNSDRLYCFIDSNNLIISSAVQGLYMQTPLMVIAPTNAAKLIVNDEASGLVSWQSEKALSYIKRTLYHIEDLLFDSDVAFTIEQENKYYDISKQLVSSNSFNVAKVNVSGLDTILLNARCAYASCSYWVDANDNMTLAFIGNFNDGVNAQMALCVPTDAKYLYVSYANAVPLVIKTYGDKNIFNALAELKEHIDATLKYDSTVYGKYLNSVGEEVDFGTSSNIEKYNISTCSKIHIKARIGLLMYVIFYDSSNNILTKYAGNIDEGINVDADFPVPNNASYVRVSHSTEYPCYVTLFAESLQSQIDQINETIGGDIEYDSVINGKFLDVNGDEQTLSSYKIYKYLFNGELKKIHLKVRMGEAAYSKFYDASDNIVGSIQGNSQEGLNIDSDYDVPNGATYIRISSSNEAICEITPVGDGILQTLEYIKQVINGVDTQWNGKKIGLLGDSIAAGSAASSVEQRFINVAATYLGASVKNAAIGGWYLGDEEGKSIYRQVNGVSPATTSLDGDEDLIVIFAGTNDFGHAFTIGNAYTEVTSSGATRKVPSTIDTETCGGLVKTIQTLYTKYGGYIPIVICTPIQRYASGGDSQETGHAPLGPWAKNSAGKYLDDYIEGIKSVATLYGIPVFDCYHNNMNPNIAAACTKYFGTTSNPSGDGLHPNDAGHELLGKQLAYFLKTHFFDV